MKLSHLLMTTSLCAVVAMPAAAQARTFSEVDSNRDGQLSQSELETAFGAAGANSFLKRNDRDGNGTVSVAEIQISQDDESDESDDDDDRDSDESDDNDDRDSDESDDNDDRDSDESDDNDDRDSDESDDDDDRDSDESDDD
jgi:hypothetical protein